MEGELQYINPPGHREMLQHIVIADIPELKNKLKSCISVSLRVDGSVDRFQIDNIHVLLKIITKEGNTDLLFLGFEDYNYSQIIYNFFSSICNLVIFLLPSNYKGVLRICILQLNCSR